MSPIPKRALLRAGGEGTRLRPLTLTTPKCLVQIRGTPLLAFWLDTLLLPPRQNPEQIWTIALVADNPGEWALERQMIGAAETASSSWFEVT